jgi:membrane protein
MSKMGEDTSTRVKRAYTAVHDFFTEKWIETHEESKTTFLHKFAHFCLLVLKSFLRNKCPLRATALSYATLLALVPLLAVGVSITSGLLQEKGAETTHQLIGQFVDAVVPQLQLVPPGTYPEDFIGPRPARSSAREQVVTQINEFIGNIQTKTLGAGGILGLILVAILLLSNIEDTFNDIWGVTRGRGWFWRLVQYWATISLGPIALTAGIVLFSSSYIQTAESFIADLRWVGQLFFKALPFIVVSLTFMLLYKFMPNTQVRWVAALIGGIVGGSFWLLINIFSAIFLTRVVTVSKIYGTSLALIPIFLIGLYFSWMIVLFGAQVAYAYQNRLVYVQEKKAENVSQRSREYIALRVMTYICERFEHGLRPPTLLDISTRIGVPSRLVGRVMQPLCDANLVNVVSVNQEEGYSPGRPLEAITCHDILYSMRTVGGQELATRDDPSRAMVCGEFDQIETAERQRASAVTMKELVARIQPESAVGNEVKVEPIWKSA